MCTFGLKITQHFKHSVWGNAYT